MRDVSCCESDLTFDLCDPVSSGSSQGSHTSKYFGSIDSSENDHSRKQPAGGGSSTGDGGEEQFIKCVLQDPIWLLMANTDDKVMMTYQLPIRYRPQVHCLKHTVHRPKVAHQRVRSDPKYKNYTKHEQSVDGWTKCPPFFPSFFSLLFCYFLFFCSASNLNPI